MWASNVGTYQHKDTRRVCSLLLTFTPWAPLVETLEELPFMVGETGQITAATEGGINLHWDPSTCDPHETSDLICS